MNASNMYTHPVEHVKADTSLFKAALHANNGWLYGLVIAPCKACAERALLENKDGEPPSSMWQWPSAVWMPDGYLDLHCPNHTKVIRQDGPFGGEPFLAIARWNRYQWADLDQDSSQYGYNCAEVEALFTGFYKIGTSLTKGMVQNKLTVLRHLLRKHAVSVYEVFIDGIDVTSRVIPETISVSSDTAGFTLSNKLNHQTTCELRKETSEQLQSWYPPDVPVGHLPDLDVFATKVVIKTRLVSSLERVVVFAGRVKSTLHNEDYRYNGFSGPISCSAVAVGCIADSALAEADARAEQTVLDLAKDYDFLARPKLAALGFSEDCVKNAVKDYNAKASHPRHSDKPAAGYVSDQAAAYSGHAYFQGLKCLLDIFPNDTDIIVLSLLHRGPDDPEAKLQPVLWVKRDGAVEVKPGWGQRMDETAMAFWRALAHFYLALPPPVSAKQEAIIEFCKTQHMTLAEFDRHYYAKPGLTDAHMNGDTTGFGWEIVNIFGNPVKP